LNFPRPSVPRAIRRAGLLLLILALIFCELPECPGQSVVNGKISGVKRVLMIFGEGKDLPGNITMEQAVRAELQKASTNRIEFLGEYLDASHFTDSEHFHVFQDYLGKKYAGQQLDLIMVFPAREYRLVSDLPAALFPGVPVIFTGVSEIETPEMFGKLGVSGIIQRFDLRDTLGMIVRLQPDTHSIVVIGGRSETDRATLARIEDVGRSLEGVTFDFWTNRPVAELEGAVKSLPEGTVILLSTVQRDVTGQPFFMSQLVQEIAPAANVPIYVLSSSAIGSGALGGSVVDSEDLGTRSAQLALQVLGGARPKDLPIEVETRGTPMVDWRALERWHLNESRLPANSVIRFRPQTLWDEHRELILISMAIFIAQAGTIAGLLAQRRQRRRAEAELLTQRTELAHVGRVSTMGQLASSLAHELTQPLGAILRNTEAAEIYLQNEKPDLNEIRAILTDIRKDDERAGNVIVRMRSLLKRQNFESKLLDFGALLVETIALARPDARMRGVNLNLQLPPRLPAVSGDRVHLQQVLLNLILNGMDAMADCTRANRVLTVQVEMNDDGRVELSVSDRGAGIPEGKVERLFEPFFTTKPNGMGMGLAISQTIIEAHGGKIWGGNNLHGGAIFKFTLPVNKV